MRMVKLLVPLPVPLKGKLEGLRVQGTTASGFVRVLLEGDFKQAETAVQKGR